MSDKMLCTTEEKADKVLGMLASTPDGCIRDADTILMDAVDEADFEISGLACEVIQTWKKSSDKDSMEKLFQTLTGCRFTEWLDRCLLESTQPGT